MEHQPPSRRIRPFVAKLWVVNRHRHEEGLSAVVDRFPAVVHQAEPAQKIVEMQGANLEGGQWTETEHQLVAEVCRKGPIIIVDAANLEDQPAKRAVKGAEVLPGEGKRVKEERRRRGTTGGINHHEETQTHLSAALRPPKNLLGDRTSNKKRAKTMVPHHRRVG